MSSVVNIVFKRKRFDNGPRAVSEISAPLASYSNTIGDEYVTLISSVSTKNVALC